MAQSRREEVALLNRDRQDYSEQFKGDKVTIPAGMAIKMSRRDAVAFRGTYAGNVEGDPTRLKIKNLIMIPIDEINPKLVAGELKDLMSPPAGNFVCNFDGKEFPSQEALNEHLSKLKDRRVKKDDYGNVVYGDETVAIEKELVDVNELVSCPFCGKDGLKGRLGLQSHLRACPKALDPIDQAELEAEKDKNPETDEVVVQ